MSILNLFPARVAIGKGLDANGNEVDIYASEEFLRALTALFKRVGGANGMGNDELALLAAFMSVAPAQSDAFDAQIMAAPDQSARVIELEKRLEELQIQLQMALAQLGAVGALEQRLADIQAHASIFQSPAAVPPQEIMVESAMSAVAFAELQKTVMSLAIEAAFGPPGTDWEHPGSIGLKTPAPGAFTTLSASGAITAGSTIAATGLVTSDAGFRRSAAAASAGYIASQLDGSSAVHGLYWDATDPCLVRAGTIRLKATSAGAEVIGTTKSTGLTSSDIGFRRSAAAGTAGYMCSQLDGASAVHGLYWDGTNINLVSAGTIVATISTTGMVIGAGKLTTLGGATLHTTSTALTNGAGAATGTLTNAPAAGNPTKWIGINDNGTTRYVPSW
jgi:hypothetical protein